jgi:SAM-dependent methyltransferase
MSGEQRRSIERLRHHYEVEKELGDRLRVSTREERTALFATLYDQLFERVPDHPRLTRRETPEDSRRSVEARMAILRGQLRPGDTLVEIAPGDCRLAYEACRHVGKVIGIDISDQRAKGDVAPGNFELVVYDGYHVDLPEGVADVAFSYQFLEHLHPDDVPLHLEMVRRLLKPGGCYVFDTPHAISGPHDISRFFSVKPEGFHLKEWTYREMFAALREAGFSDAHTFWHRRIWKSGLSKALVLGLERVLGLMPRPLSMPLRSRLFSAVTMIAIR